MENCIFDINNFPFGSYKLSESVLNVIRNEESKCKVEDFSVDSKILSLICKVEELQNKESCNKVVERKALDCLNDFLQEPVISAPKKVTVPTSNVNIKEEPIQASYLTNKLIHSVKQDTGIQEIINIIAKVSENLLQESLTNAWNRLKLPEEKQKLIKLLSSYQSCLSTLCRNVILPELKEEDRFHSTVEAVVPVIESLQSCIIHDVLMTLLVEEESCLIREAVWFKEIMNSLSISQKYELITSFINVMEECLNKHLLQVFSSILEDAPLKENEIPRLVSLLNADIDNFKDDRYLGKILLNVVDSYSSATSKPVNKELAQLCSNFKGVMRFRINAALKKCLI